MAATSTNTDVTRRARRRGDRLVTVGPAEDSSGISNSRHIMRDRTAHNRGPMTAWRSRTTAWWTFSALAMLLLPLMVTVSLDFGVTWDEGARHANGVRVWEYLAGGRDPSLLRGGHVYGGLFDVVAVAAERYFDANRWVARHAVNAVFGWMGAVFCGALAARLFGAWTGVLAMVLIASSPRYFADSMNNPKDLPFAAASVATLYALSTLSSTWPYISRTSAFWIITTLAAALNTRPAAILNIGFLGLLLAVFVVLERNTDWRRLLITAVHFTIVVVAALLLGTLFWPWAQQAPLVRPFQALFEASEFPWAGQVLFDGRNYRAPDLPWYYALRWLLISTPPVVLVGLVLAAIPGSRLWTFRRLALLFVVLLPLSLVFIKDSTLYDGVRHLLFIYPALVVLAASGWAVLLTRTKGWVQGAAATVLLAGVLNVVIFQVRSHPHQTVYFNELVGGPRGAVGNFDLDYWGNCVLEAIEWTAEKARSEGRTITISGWPAHLAQQNATRFPDVVFDRREHEVLIRLNRGTRQRVTDLARRDDVLYRVQTPDGAVLCAVLPGTAALPPPPPSVDLPESDDR